MLSDTILKDKTVHNMLIHHAWAEAKNTSAMGKNNVTGEARMRRICVLFRSFLLFLAITGLWSVPAAATPAEVISSQLQSPLPPGYDGWDSVFTAYEFDGPVKAMLATDHGLYIAGGFTQAGPVVANSIVLMDSNGFHTLGAGITGYVNALAYENGSLYVGGSFTQAGGLSTSNLARWDGSQWHVLGKRVYGEVFALAIKDNLLYAGGEFSATQDGQAANIAAWDGVRWSPLGAGLSGDPSTYEPSLVSSICFLGGLMYVGGDFDLSGSKLLNNIAAWNGLEWIELAGGVTNPGAYAAVNNLLCHDGRVYAAGFFSQAGAIATNGGAYWDGLWHAMDAGSGLTALSAAPDGNIYAGGYGQSMVWSSSGWQSLGDTHALDRINTLTWFGDLLYAGTDAFPYGFAWKDEWLKLGNGLNGDVYAITVHNDEIYVSGGFTQAGTAPARRVARWDGSRWHALAGGLTEIDPAYSANIEVLESINGNLYAAGWFTRAGDQPAKYIAYWEGNAWHAVGSNLETPPRALAYHQGTLYAAGFLLLGDSNFARWNGSTWEALPSPTGLIACLEILNGELYAGTEWSGVLRWNGSDWDIVGPELTGYIPTLAAWGDTIYAGGMDLRLNFTSINSIAYWDGVSWHSLENSIGPGSLMGPEVKSLVYTGEYLYAGGYFNQVAGLPIWNIARWDGMSWEALGTEILPVVEQLHYHDGVLYVAAPHKFMLWHEPARVYLPQMIAP